MQKIKNIVSSIQDIKDTVSKICVTVMKASIGKALYIEANKEDVEGLNKKTISELNES